MKIHIVHVAGQDKPRLVKSHTKAGAEKFVRDSIKPAVTASVPTQDELLSARDAGVQIEYVPGTEPPQPNPVSQHDHE